MTCEEVRMSLGVHALGALDPEEALEVDRHLADCEACGAELLELEDVTSYLEKVSERDVELVASPPRQVLDRLLNDRVRRTRRGRMLLLSAASVAALVLGGTVWSAVTGDGGPATTAAQAPESAASAREPATMADQGQALSAGPERKAVPTPSASSRAVTGPEFKGENEEADYYATVMAWPDEDGTELGVQVRGVPAGTRCHVLVIGAAGQRDVTESWVIGTGAYSRRTAFRTETRLALKDIARFELVDDRSGKVLVKVAGK
ncbi:zf-HC2 domain-containing protein [Actinomadura sp. ATCC 31491]|uniref:Zf-HC2 domain-containing protein n=1 Tax=Actinomadura luzonensis TaxID=2805427 RepID=A0ABT0FRI3_9ACTN|nr:zf-HC2 domain-containing protein [Actinomadura luzonensis]MCK2214937.1 zf-HC2 domain-containing protein [Actinomadura luzonensis]